MIWFTNMFVVGIIPEFFDETDPRPAREQADENYAHGGGWHPTPNLKLRITGSEYWLDSVFAEDPPFKELSRAKLQHETLVFFQGSWLAIIQPDGSYEVSRMD